MGLTSRQTVLPTTAWIQAQVDWWSGWRYCCLPRRWRHLLPLSTMQKHLWLMESARRPLTWFWDWLLKRWNWFQPSHWINAKWLGTRSCKEESWASSSRDIDVFPACSKQTVNRSLLKDGLSTPKKQHGTVIFGWNALESYSNSNSWVIPMDWEV